MGHADALSTGPPTGRGLYCNRTLNLRSIKVIGYDMDYTLVHYHVEDWERRAYAHMRDKLQAGGWPVGDLEFGAVAAQCGPTALLSSGGRVRLVFGLLDSENAALIIAGEDPVLTGPPAAVSSTKVHFATNDPLLNPPDATAEASLLLYHMGRATRYPRR